MAISALGGLDYDSADDYYDGITDVGTILSNPDYYVNYGSGACDCPCNPRPSYVVEEVCPLYWEPTVDATTNEPIGCGTCGEQKKCMGRMTCEEWVESSNRMSNDAYTDLPYDGTAGIEYILANPWDFRYDVSDGHEALYESCVCPCKEAQACTDYWFEVSEIGSDGNPVYGGSAARVSMNLLGQAPGTSLDPMYSLTTECLKPGCYEVVFSTPPASAASHPERTTWEITENHPALGKYSVASGIYDASPHRVSLGGVSCTSPGPSPTVEGTISEAISDVLGDPDKTPVTVSLAADGVTVVLETTVIVPTGVDISIEGIPDEVVRRRMSGGSGSDGDGDASSSGSGNRRLSFNAGSDLPLVEISGDDSVGLFTLARDSVLTLTNLVLTKGRVYTPYGGGAAVNNGGGGTLTVVSCEFSDNVAGGKLSRGGAIYNNKGGILTITDSNFVNNKAWQAGAIYHQGGTGILDGPMSIQRTSFQYNAAAAVGLNPTKSDGGAILAELGSFTLDDVVFKGNDAFSGGAIYIRTQVKAAADAVVFDGNTAEDMGGAVNMIDGATLEISNENGRNCECVDNEVGGKGGCFAVSSSTLKVTGMSFTDNKVINSAVGSSIYSSGSSTFLDECSFDGHTDPNSNFIVYAILNGGHLTFDTCSFEETTANTAKALYADDYIVIRNTDLLLSDAQFPKSPSWAADCSFADDTNINLLCAEEYCSDRDSGFLGITCACTTYWGDKDPVKEGCENPPIIYVPVESLDGITDKNSNLVHTFFLTNKGDYPLSWAVSQDGTEVDPLLWSISPMNGEIGGCSLQQIQITLSPEGVEPHLRLASAFTIVSNSYPLTFDEEWDEAEWITNLDASAYVKAASDASKTIVTHSVSSFDRPTTDLITHLNAAVGGTHYFSKIKPISWDGLHIKRGGAELFKATVTPKGLRLNGSEQEPLQCDVYYNSGTDEYEVDCLLPWQDVGDFYLGVTLTTSDEGVITKTLVTDPPIEINVACKSEFVRQSGNLCVCDKGDYMNYPAQKCQACPIGTWSDEMGASSVGDCERCERWIGGEFPATTAVTRRTSFSDCGCTVGNYLSLFEGKDLDQPEEDMGECLQCPLGGTCLKIEEIDQEPAAVLALRGTNIPEILVNPGWWRTSTESEVMYPCMLFGACVGTLNATETWGECSENSIGVLCNVCAPKTYKGMGGTACVLCPTSGMNPGLVYGVLFGLAAFFAFAMFKWHQRHEAQLKLLEAETAEVQAELAIEQQRKEEEQKKDEAEKLSALKSKMAGMLPKAKKASQASKGDVELTPIEDITNEEDEHKEATKVAASDASEPERRKSLLETAGDAAKIAVANTQVAMAIASQAAETAVVAASTSDNVRNTAMRTTQTLMKMKAGAQLNVVSQVAVDQDAITESMQGAFDGGSFDDMDQSAQTVKSTASSVKIASGNMGLMQSFLSFGKYPAGMEKLLGVFGIVNLDAPSVLPFACMYSWWEWYDSYLVATLWPIAVIGSMMLMSKLLWLRVNTSDKTTGDFGTQGPYALRSLNLYNKAIWVSFLIYTSISSQVFKAFICDEYDGGVMVLHAHYGVDCNSEKYKKFRSYAIAMIFLYPIGVPLTYFVAVFRSRAIIGVENFTEKFNLSTKVMEEDKDLRVKDERIMHLAFLFKQYKAKFWYWEVIECLRKVILAGFLTLAYNGKITQACIGCGVIVMFTLSYSYVQPYRDQRDNLNMLVGQTVSFAVLFCGLMQMMDLPEIDGYNKSSFNGIMIGICFIPVAMCIKTVWDETVMMRKNQKLLLELMRQKLAKEKAQKNLKTALIASKAAAAFKVGAKLGGGSGAKIAPGGSGEEKKTAD